MNHKLYKNYWNKIPSWEKIIHLLDRNVPLKTEVRFFDRLGFIIRNANGVEEAQELLDHIKEIHYEPLPPNCHIYASLLSNSGTFKNHQDTSDVYIVQAHGSVRYIVTEEDEQKYDYTVEPGDMLYIKKFLFHEPILLGPRVTMSVAFN